MTLGSRRCEQKTIYICTGFKSHGRLLLELELYSFLSGIDYLFSQEEAKAGEFEGNITTMECSMLQEEFT